MHQEHKELLQELYETYQKALRLAALSKKVPECEVNDIVQDTFMAFMINMKPNSLSGILPSRKRC